MPFYHQQWSTTGVPHGPLLFTIYTHTHNFLISILMSIYVDDIMLYCAFTYPSRSIYIYFDFVHMIKTSLSWYIAFVLSYKVLFALNCKDIVHYHIALSSVKQRVTVHHQWHILFSLLLLFVLSLFQLVVVDVQWKYGEKMPVQTMWSWIYCLLNWWR